MLQLRIFKRLLEELCLRQSPCQALKGLIVQVAGHPLALGLPNFAQLLLYLIALNSRSEDVCHGFKKVHIILTELPLLLRIRTQDPKRAVPAADDNAHAAHYPVVSKQGRSFEAFFSA